MMGAKVPGKPSFDEVVGKMPKLLRQLLATPLLSRKALKAVPGVYVFYENDCPLYVGRSKAIKQRVLRHGQNSRKQNSASFAFRLAEKEAGDEFKEMTRGQKEEGPRFKALFVKSKERVRAMKVRAIEINDPIEQTLFEVYAALELKTCHNDFDTH